MISQLFSVTNIVTGLVTSSPMRAITTYSYEYIDSFSIGVVNSEIREVH